MLTSGIDGNPGGLAGVWATQNTRDAIFDAMQRREVFGTSGPRITVRFFAGWNIDANACEDPDMIANAYAQGVPMGGDLPQGSGKPTLLAFANQDPNSQGLSELHLIKGWVDADDQLHTEVIPLMTASAPASSMCKTFVDESFEANTPTYYYLRAVEPESPRWHTYDCERIDADNRPAVCAAETYPNTVQEMAWSSPIWYQP